MKNILHSKPVDYFTQRGFSYFIMKYVSEDAIRNKTILDVGCGWGSFVLSTLKLNPCKVAGIDVTQPDIQNALENIKDPRVSFAVASALKLPFPDESFDTVTAWEVIEHIPKGTEPQFFNEIHRVLKKNGCFYFSTPNKNIWSCLGDPAWWLIGHRHYSTVDIEKFAEKARFQVRDLYVWGNFYNIIATLNMYVAKWIFRREPFFLNYFNNKIDCSLEKKETGFAGIVGYMQKN